jgi:hypothetical protein
VVDELVKKGAAKFKELGAVVEEVSIPWISPAWRCGRRSPSKAPPGR